MKFPFISHTVENQLGWDIGMCTWHTQFCPFFSKGKDSVSININKTIVNQSVKTTSPLLSSALNSQG